MSDQDRIRLAEAMGWKVEIVTINPVADEPIESWQSPDGSYSRFSPPDPYTDANDCEALMRHLTSKKWMIQLEVWHDEAMVRIITYTRDRPWLLWRGDDYKQGVCELALKVLDDE